MVKVPPPAVERPQPMKLYGWPGLMAKCWPLPCQPAVATSFTELLPRWASAGVVSIVACGARAQLAELASKPALMSRLIDVANVPSGLDPLFPYESVLVDLKW